MYIGRRSVRANGKGKKHRFAVIAWLRSLRRCNRTFAKLEVFGHQMYIAVKNKAKSAAAFTMVEVMVTMVILGIAAVGALSYQYYAAAHVRIAGTQITTTRTAQMLLEDWKSTGGSTDYDPTILGLGFSSLSSSDFSQWWGLGVPLRDEVYTITINDVTMLVVPAWKDIEYDSAAGVTLRQLAVAVYWKQKQKTQDQEQDIVVEEMGSSEFQQRVTLTTYVRLDASGG